MTHETTHKYPEPPRTEWIPFDPNRIHEEPEPLPPLAESTWILERDRQGTEDVMFLLDHNGQTLAASREFWMPEPGDDAARTLEAMRLMASAPKLLAALQNFLAVPGIAGYGFDEECRVAQAAIAEATGGAQ